jgi:YHS domain-containing protein
MILTSIVFEGVRNKAIALAAIISVVLCGFFYISDSANAASPEIASILSQAPPGDVGKKTVCAYCGMRLTVKSDTPAAKFDGKDYYFCDDMERDAFVKTPEKYLSKQPSAGIASAAKSSP